MGTHPLSPVAGELAACALSHGSVGIVAALASEARAFTRRRLPTRATAALDAGHTLWLAGMGQEAARQGALALVQAGATALVSFGVAGGLAPGLRSGTLVCPSCVLDERGHDYLPDPAWRQRLAQRLHGVAVTRVMEGNLLSLPAPLLSSSEKGAMRERHQALAVDMESAAIASIAAQHRLPFLVLRAIVDERDDTVPAALQAGVDEWGRPLAGRMLATLWRHPGLLAQLPWLALRMGKATRALRVAASTAGAGLGRELPQPC